MPCYLFFEQKNVNRVKKKKEADQKWSVFPSKVCHLLSQKK